MLRRRGPEGGAGPGGPRRDPAAPPGAEAALCPPPPGSRGPRAPPVVAPLASPRSPLRRPAPPPALARRRRSPSPLRASARRTSGLPAAARPRFPREEAREGGGGGGGRHVTPRHIPAQPQGSITSAPPAPHRHRVHPATLHAQPANFPLHRGRREQDRSTKSKVLAGTARRSGARAANFPGTARGSWGPEPGARCSRPGPGLFTARRAEQNPSARGAGRGGEERGPSVLAWRGRDPGPRFPLSEMTFFSSSKERKNKASHGFACLFFAKTHNRNFSLQPRRRFQTGDGFFRPPSRSRRFRVFHFFFSFFLGGAVLSLLAHFPLPPHRGILLPLLSPTPTPHPRSTWGLGGEGSARAPALTLTLTRAPARGHAAPLRSPQ